MNGYKAVIFYEDQKWTVRVVPANGRLFFYIDIPRNGDDGSLNHVIDWASIAEKHSPLILLGDYPGIPNCCSNQLVFKSSCPIFKPNAVAFFHFVDIDIEPKSIDDCQFWSGFQGSTSTNPCRKDIAELDRSLFYFNERNLFWTYSESEQQNLHREYVDLLNDTKFPLCPRGKGLNSIRFFESLRLGRIPVLIADHAKLPLSWKIDYDEFVIRVPEYQVVQVKDYIDAWVDSHNLKEASKKAREVSLKYFSDPNKFIDLCLKELLG